MMELICISFNKIILLLIFMDVIVSMKNVVFFYIDIIYLYRYLINNFLLKCLIVTISNKKCLQLF